MQESGDLEPCQRISAVSTGFRWPFLPDLHQALRSGRKETPSTERFDTISKPLKKDKTMDYAELDEHECDRNESWAEYDAQGIYLCRVCEKCEKSKLSRYRPEILTGYTQADVDEPIEES